MTNEASGPPPTATNQASDPAPTVTNEASRPATTATNQAGGSASDGRGSSEPDLGPIDGPTDLEAGGPAAAHPPGNWPDDGADVDTCESGRSVADPSRAETGWPSNRPGLGLAPP
jgi:hypothetical protein